MSKFNRIAILGSNSFAGATFLTRAIEDGYEVIGINRSPEGSDIFLPYKNLVLKNNYNFFKADINKDFNEIVNVLDDFKPEIIVDFAGQGMVAQSWENPHQWYNTNITSKVKLHKYLSDCDYLKRFIRISTPEVYGSQDELLKETRSYNPSTPYAVSHSAQDMSLNAFYNNYNFPVIFTRYANFYGPGQQLYRIIPRTIIYALTGKKLQLHGGGSSIRAFIHCNDVADGIMKSINKGKIGEIYHFSPSKFYSIKNVVETVCEELNFSFSKLVEVSDDRQGKDKAYLMNSEKARNELDWNDNISLKEGINDTIIWIKKNLKEISNLPLNYKHKI
jgi:dTDP-glucose 4,6-dehydratase